MADVDFAQCEQPDELVQLAWNAGLDRKAVIREGSDAARLLTAQRNDIRSLFWPFPLPLEAVDRWADNSSATSDTARPLRPFASAVVPGCIVGSLVSHFFIAPHMPEQTGLTTLVVILVAIVVLGVFFKVMIEAVVRRRVARLDDERALAIVLAQLRRGMTGRPALVSYAVKGMREGLAAFTASLRRN